MITFFQLAFYSTYLSQIAKPSIKAIRYRSYLKNIHVFDDIQGGYPNNDSQPYPRPSERNRGSLKNSLCPSLPSLIRVADAVTPQPAFPFGHPDSCGPHNSTATGQIRFISRSMEQSCPLDMQWYGHWLVDHCRPFRSGTNFFADVTSTQPLGQYDLVTMQIYSSGIIWTIISANWPLEFES